MMAPVAAPIAAPAKAPPAPRPAAPPIMPPSAPPMIAPASGSCAAACCAGSKADNANSTPAPKLRIIAVLPSLFRRRRGVAGLYLLRPPRVVITYEYPRAKMWPAHGAVHRRIPSSGEPWHQASLGIRRALASGKSWHQAQRSFPVDRGALGVGERIGGKPVRRLDGFAI